jgi:cysteinyl-tRNA synthetase
LFLQSHYRTQANFTWDSLQAAREHLQNLRAWADLKHQQPGTAGIVALRPVKGAVFTDLNTPKALAELAELKDAPEQAALELIDGLLGLELSNRPDIDSSQKNLITRREQARVHEDWPESDRLRDELAASGLGINDTPDGPLWCRISG